MKHSSNVDVLYFRFYSLIGPGDTVNVIGEFDGHGRCTIDRNYNLIIVHPHILVSGTRVIFILLFVGSDLRSFLPLDGHFTPIGLPIGFYIFPIIEFYSWSNLGFL